MDFEEAARQPAANTDHGECDDRDDCDDPDCACHQDAGERPGDGAAEVTMTEVYKDEPAWDRTCGW